MNIRQLYLKFQKALKVDRDLAKMLLINLYEALCGCEWSFKRDKEPLEIGGFYFKSEEDSKGYIKGEVFNIIDDMTQEEIDWFLDHKELLVAMLMKNEDFLEYGMGLDWIPEQHRILVEANNFQGI